MAIHEAAHAFLFDDTPVSCQEFGNGHINNTYKIESASGNRYVLQHINQYVFKNPVEVMENISAVTNHIQHRSSDICSTPKYLRTRDGAYFHKDKDGEYWRMCEYVSGLCLEAPESDEDLYQSALAFGWFQEALSDFPAHTLYETIPNFHNTVDRYAQFKESVKKDFAGRAVRAQKEIDFLLAREEMAGTLVRELEEGKLPLRVTHNDTKLNNVLLTRDTRKCLCVLDLDTVMPGSSLYDFGDAIRFGASTAEEDEEDVSKIGINLDLFRIYTKGYLEALPSLTEEEIRLLPLSAIVITLELATRFLKDYLDGDLYFKTKKPDHNLIRAKSQIALAYDMEKKLPQMKKIVAELRG